MHGLWEGYRCTRVNYSIATINKTNSVDSLIRTDNIGGFRLCISIDMGGRKGK